ncbi:MAPEG family protein [Wenzhouxiangella marina]|uniref:Membrane protein n=1 Tax=Wenzhouxiangella marina TaxID=1579979 RepID=A0A0K0XUG8_9GAMM|nr:MAPEG family protein [Wenzhouxiangella marina]AKS41359.1 membrane protein [Wenzhouxiangella marina]MBB6086889.1 putative MAPEG superfamily protein [Wenzhouxiangella marina]
MTIAYWCVLIAAIIPYLMVGVAKIGHRGYNNRAPRAWAEKLEGYRQRASWAQQNGFEIFPFFAAAVIIASLAGADQARIDALAITFVATRLAYGVCYLADLHLWRSLVWVASFGICVALFVIAA